MSTRKGMIGIARSHQAQSCASTPRKSRVAALPDNAAWRRDSIGW
jgi:hypothetical protein